MFGSQILEVAIGIIFIFILVSIICSTIREGIEAWLKTRAAYLEYGVRQLLNDKKATGLAKSFYEHPLIASLYSGDYTPGGDAAQPPILAKGKSLPSYIPSRNFAIALMDIAARGPLTDDVSSHPDAPGISLATVRMNILNLNNPTVQRALLTAIDTAQGDLNAARQNIEAWYDSAMDRVSGWYKRSTHWILFWVGIIVAVGLNVNSLTIANYLYSNDAAREALVARATEAAKDTSFLNTRYDQATHELNALQLPLGWANGANAGQGNSDSFALWNDVFLPLLGWLVTALAATMGAPFWFDLLNKVMVIRSTVKPHEKSPEESSEDRQTDIAVPAQAPAPPSQPGVIAKAPTVEFSPAAEGIANVRDDSSSIDACGVSIENITTDEQLPPAEGGVA